MSARPAAVSQIASLSTSRRPAHATFRAPTRQRRLAAIERATLLLGGLSLTDVPMKRVGTRGLSYRYAAPGVDLRMDFAKATFTLKATVQKLADLVDAAAGSATNDPKSVVGGMNLSFVLFVSHVYEASFDVPMVRQKGGKVFQR